MDSVKLYINVTVGGKTRRIDISHDRSVCDAVITVDGQSVETRSKMVSGGGYIEFELENNNIKLLITNSDGEYGYDCFVNGVSVQNGMPWKLGKCTLPEVLSWGKKRVSDKRRYVVSEALRGAILGCVLFFVFYILQYFINALAGKVDLLWLLVCVCVPALIFGSMAPGEFKKNEAAYKEYTDYKNQNQ